MSRFGLTGNATLVDGGDGIILLEVKSALVKSKVVLGVVDAAVGDRLIFWGSDEGLLHGGVNGEL